MPREKSSDCVYRIDCLGCNKVYVGETTQRLETRIKQHEATVRSQSEPKTALARHAKSTGHALNFDDVHVLEHNNNKRKLQICEINHIILNQHIACNFKTDTASIAPAYSNLLREHQNRLHPTTTAHTTHTHAASNSWRLSTSDNKISCSFVDLYLTFLTTAPLLSFWQRI